MPPAPAGLTLIHPGSKLSAGINCKSKGFVGCSTGSNDWMETAGDSCQRGGVLERNPFAGTLLAGTSPPALGSCCPEKADVTSLVWTEPFAPGITSGGTDACWQCPPINSSSQVQQQSLVFPRTHSNPFACPMSLKAGHKPGCKPARSLCPVSAGPVAGSSCAWPVPCNFSSLSNVGCLAPVPTGFYWAGPHFASAAVTKGVPAAETLVPMLGSIPG